MMYSLVGAPFYDERYQCYKKIIRIARTIADLENKKEIDTQHILEALQYRPRMGSSRLELQSEHGDQ